MALSGLQSIAKTILYKAGYSIKRIRARPIGVTSLTSHSDSSPPDLMRLLHKVNPYEAFDFRSYAFDASGWGGDSPAFRTLILELKPRLIIEVGSWKGHSALQMAAVTCEAGLQTQILCVDTWLGALEFWTEQDDPERYLSLGLRHGYPTVYYQFLANVCHKSFQDRIVPFPQTSSIAALWLRYYGITPELVYIDASHEEEDVYSDLCNYWPLVSENGVLFGDDYAWDGVRIAVNRFAQEERRGLEFVADKWLLRKRH
jgi:methyltransferase family protein